MIAWCPSVAFVALTVDVRTEREGKAALGRYGIRSGAVGGIVEAGGTMDA